MDEFDGCFFNDANQKDFSKATNLEVEAMPKPSKKRKEVTTSPKVTQKEATTTSVVAPEQTQADAVNNDGEGWQLEKRKPTRAPSWVWEHFTKKVIKGASKAVCNYCGAIYSFKSSKNGTSIMSNHLRVQCRKFPKDRDPRQKILPFQPKTKDSGESGGCNLTAVAFDKEACRLAFARMIIVDELTFRFAEGEGFRFFMSIAQPLFQVPSRITSARDVSKLYITEKKKLKDVLSRNLQHVSLTTDCWTSIQNLNYMCLTVHFIDNDWVYHKRIIGFYQIPDHKGETIGKALENKLSEWGIEKVFAITVDNATSNDIAVAYLKKKIRDWGGSVLNGELLHMRCCAHILNLIVNEGLKELHDLILKIRNAVRYVRASPSRMQRFKTCVEREKIQCKSLVCLDVSTRWNSTYLMLEAALKFQKAFERLYNTDGLYLMEFSFGENVSERKRGPPEFEDWESAEKFVKFLKVFYDATVRISGSTHVTSHMYFHDFSTILNLLNKCCGSSDPLFSVIAENMKIKHEKYWGAASSMNILFFIACVLDPRYKLRFVEFVFEKLYDKVIAETLSCKVKSTLNRMFEEYSTFVGFMEENNSNSSRQSSQDKDDEAINENFSVFADLYDEKMSLENEDHKNEVDVYLAEDKEKKSDNFNILNWWKVNSPRYPVLSLIARDVLAVPMSTVASESAFSTGGRVLDPYRSSLSPKTVETLICTQNWFRSTPLPEKMETQEAADEIEQEIAKLSNDIVDLEL